MSDAFFLPDEALSPDLFNQRNVDFLPGHMGLVITELTRTGAKAYFEICSHHHAPNGFLHAGSLIALADSLCGFACTAALPAGATGFTTIELKTNFFSTALDGHIEGVATPVHLGGSTQVWDCEITHRETGKRMALFRCTQMVLRPRK